MKGECNVIYYLIFKITLHYTISYAIDFIVEFSSIPKTMLSSIFFLFLTLFFFIFTLFKQLKKPIVEKKLPPGPRALPLIGNLHQLGPLLHQSLQHLSNKYGPLMFLKLGSIPTLVVSSSDIAKEIFKNHDLVFSGRPNLYAAKRLGYNGSVVSFAPYGDYWREMRKIVILELLSAKRVQSFEAVRFEEVKFLLHSIQHSSEPVNLSELTVSITNNIVCRIASGRRFGGGTENNSSKFTEMIRETQELLGGFCVSDFFPRLEWMNKFNGLERRLEKNFKELDKFYDQVIEEHVNSNNDSDQQSSEAEQENLVDVLLHVQKDPNQAISISNNQIKGVLADIFIAGTDTSSATMIWTLSELIRNPEAMKRTQQEIREVVKEKEMVEESDLSKLMYLKLVIKEALRLHPPAPLLVPRETTETCTLKGFEIPSKTRVFINAKSIATDPNCWENPNEFLPERFLTSSIDFRGQHFELLPFGAGRRGCPGVNFAMVLIELTLANLLFRFDWELPDGVKEVDMEEAIGITMHKKSHLWLKAIPIHN